MQILDIVISHLSILFCISKKILIFKHNYNAIILSSQLTIIPWYCLVPSPYSNFPTYLRNLLLLACLKQETNKVCKLPCVIVSLRSLLSTLSFYLFFHTIDLLQKLGQLCYRMS